MFGWIMFARGKFGYIDCPRVKTKVFDPDSYRHGHKGFWSIKEAEKKTDLAIISIKLVPEWDRCDGHCDSE